MLIAMSASAIKGRHSIAVSERESMVYVAKGRRKLSRKNSGLPTGRNPHGNGYAIVGDGFR